MTDRERVLEVVDACYAALHGRVGRTPCVPCLMRLIEDERKVCARMATDECCAKDDCEHDCGYKNLAAAILDRGREHATA